MFVRYTFLRLSSAAFVLAFFLGCAGTVSAADAVSKKMAKPLAEPPKLRVVKPRVPVSATRKIKQPESQQEQGPTGGTGIYVLDNVDFNPIGGGKIPDLSWNNKIPLTSYYEYQDNSYLIISGTVHGDGLISGPGQEGWTFTVQLDDTDILSGRPTQCSFSRSNKPQTTPVQTGWKYQLMFVFLDTRTKPECYEFFKSLGQKPIVVRWARIVGPYWTGEKVFEEPRERLYKSGPMLPLNSDVTTGHDAVLW